MRTRRVVLLGVLSTLGALTTVVPRGDLGAQSPAEAVVRPTDPAGAAPTVADEESSGRPRVFATPTRRWMPRHVSLGVGGAATSPPGKGTTYSPSMGGLFDVSLIGYLTPRVTWRAEGFLLLQDRSRASATALLNEPGARSELCSARGCAPQPTETSRRSSGGALGIEYHPMRGGIGVYGVALLGIAHSTSIGDAGDRLGLAPSLGVGLLAPMSVGVDGFALELRWRRLPTALGTVDAGIASLQLRF